MASCVLGRSIHKRHGDGVCLHVDLLQLLLLKTAISAKTDGVSSEHRFRSHGEEELSMIEVLSTCSIVLPVWTEEKGIQRNK